MVVYLVALCRMSERGFEPYEGERLTAKDDAEARWKAKGWFANHASPVEEATWLRVLKDGEAILSEPVSVTELAMPRYYFDVQDDEALTHDDNGVELANLRAAEQVAAEALADMTRDKILSMSGCNLKIRIRSDEGLVSTLALNFSIARG